MSISTATFESFIHTLTDKSASIITPLFWDLGLGVDIKSDGSPVTKADRDAESAMRELIRKQFPSHGVIGEEFGRENDDAEFVWVLDPIDGTVSFAHKCPLFGTLIALLHKGQPILGAIHQPIVQQLCLGNGDETTLNGKRVRVREMRSLLEATLLATDVANIARLQNRVGFEALQQHVKVFRTWGDCYGYLLLASGFADIMVDPIMHIWDIMPLIPIVRGAGGVITAWDGTDPVGASSCVAAGRALHGEAVRLLAA